MTPELPLRPPDSQPAQRLRASLGVRPDGGWRLLPIGDCLVAVEEFPRPQAKGQPIVCLHAAGSGSREFRPLLSSPNLLPAGQRLILLDWPGHGRSPAPEGDSAAFSIQTCLATLHQTLKSLGIPRPILLASGFSAAVAVQYARTHPGEVAALFLCQPEVLFSAPASRNRPKSPPKAANSAAKRQQARLAVAQPQLQPLIEAAEASLQQSSAGLQQAFASLTCPVLFALSRQSHIQPLARTLAQLRQLLARTPQHKLAVFSGGFHPLWDEPERFAQTLDSFLQSFAPVASHRHTWLLAAADWPTQDTNLWKCAHPQCGAERMLSAGQDANHPD